ncbi:ubiquitin 3 binding protein But2 C-terminal domain-containing protein [Xylaria sp. FL1777]|nr:ubiquitin 3 binding protein But2 C-terminal domain-containing protein [Xylaria sp. FL1777]
MLVMLIPLLSVFWLHSLSPVDAHATRNNVGCGFHLSCSGAFNGSIGQKSSGQARASSDVSPASWFTWFGDAFADQAGSGCWWTPPTFTLQCDKNQPPDHGFQIGCDGSLSFNGQSVFYECPTGQGDEVNIYLRPNGDQCHEITIQADSCAPSTCPGGGVGPGGGGGVGPFPGVTNSPTSSSSSRATTPSSTTTLATTTSSSSSGNLSSTPAVSPSTPATSPSSTSQGPPTPSPFTTGGEQTTKTSITSTSTITTTLPAPSPSSSCVEVGPEQIILTDLGSPDTAYGGNDAQHIQVSPNASSIFNFRFDDADVGKMCQLSFRLLSTPPQPAFNLTGTGITAFAALEGWADANTTYNSMPRVVQPIGDIMLRAGLNTAFPPFPCPGASTRSAVLLSEGPLADTCLDCAQGGGIGMFLTKC